MHLTILTTISVFIKEVLGFLVEYLENLKLKDDLGDKPFNLSSSGGGGESSSSGKKPELNDSEYNSILNNPNNYGYSSDESDYDPRNYESDKEQSNIHDRNSEAMGANLNEFKHNLKNEKDSEVIHNMKKDFEDAIEVYQEGISPEAEKQVTILKEKVQACEDKISELETESKSKGKGRAE